MSLVDSIERDPKSILQRITLFALPTLVSAMVSAGAVVWSSSASIAHVNDRAASTERRVTAIEPIVAQQSERIASLGARQDGDDRMRLEDQQRLSRIENKLDRLLERRGN